MSIARRFSMISNRHVRFPAISSVCIDNATGGFGDLSAWKLSTWRPGALGGQMPRLRTHPEAMRVDGLSSFHRLSVAHRMRMRRAFLGQVDFRQTVINA